MFSSWCSVRRGSGDLERNGFRSTCCHRPWAPPRVRGLTFLCEGSRAFVRGWGGIELSKLPKHHKFWKSIIFANLQFAQKFRKQNEHLATLWSVPGFDWTRGCGLRHLKTAKSLSWFGKWVILGGNEHFVANISRNVDISAKFRYAGWCRPNAQCLA